MDTINYKNGDIFEGLIDFPSMKGKIIYKDGNIYEGNLINGKKDGSGKLIYKNGDIYEGFFANDDFFGKGYIKYSGGRIVSYLTKSDSGENVMFICEENTKYAIFISNNKMSSKFDLSKLPPEILVIDDLLKFLSSEIIKDTKNLSEEEIESITCPISQEIMNDPVTMNCSHSFCKENIIKLKKKLCPLCRNKFSCVIPVMDKINLLEKIIYSVGGNQITYNLVMTIKNIFSMNANFHDFIKNYPVIIDFQKKYKCGCGESFGFSQFEHRLCNICDRTNDNYPFFSCIHLHIERNHIYKDIDNQKYPCSTDMCLDCVKNKSQFNKIFDENGKIVLTYDWNGNFKNFI